MRSGLLTVVLPACNEVRSVPMAAETLTRLLTDAGIPFELLFVDDGSSDGTWDAIQAEAATDSRVRGIRFSRNFGKDAAIFAGLAQSAGDCTAVMDCDLQHPPEKLTEMYRLWQQGYQVVEGVKRSRGKENPLHSLAAGCFYSFISRAAGTDMARASDFRLLDRSAVEALLTLQEKDGFFRALSSWIGFPSARVEFEVQPRAEGTSKWSIRKLIRYAVTTLTAFTAAPLQAVSLLGCLGFLCFLVLGVFTLWNLFSGHGTDELALVVLLILLTGSILMAGMGVLGYYVGRICEELKGRPKYIIQEKTGRQHRNETPETDP